MQTQEVPLYPLLELLCLLFHSESNACFCNAHVLFAAYAVTINVSLVYIHEIPIRTDIVVYVQVEIYILTTRWGDYPQKQSDDSMLYNVHVGVSLLID